MQLLQWTHIYPKAWLVKLLHRATFMALNTLCAIVKAIKYQKYPMVEKQNLSQYPCALQSLQICSNRAHIAFGDLYYDLLMQLWRNQKTNHITHLYYSWILSFSCNMTFWYGILHFWRISFLMNIYHAISSSSTCKICIMSWQDIIADVMNIQETEQVLLFWNMRFVHIYIWQTCK